MKIKIISIFYQPKEIKINRLLLHSHTKTKEKQSKVRTKKHINTNKVFLLLQNGNKGNL